MKWGPAIVLLGIGGAAAAAPVDVERDPIWTFDRPVIEITVAHGLSAQQGILARRAAATFVYVGMCRGTGVKDVIGAIQMIMAASPDRPIEAAALEMLAIYTRAAFGRDDSWVCERAREDAVRTD